MIFLKIIYSFTVCEQGRKHVVFYTVFQSFLLGTLMYIYIYIYIYIFVSVKSNGTFNISWKLQFESYVCFQVKNALFLLAATLTACSPNVWTLSRYELCEALTITFQVRIAITKQPLNGIQLIIHSEFHIKTLPIVKLKLIHRDVAT